MYDCCMDAGERSRGTRYEKTGWPDCRNRQTNDYKRANQKAARSDSSLNLTSGKLVHAESRFFSLTATARLAFSPCAFCFFCRATGALLLKSVPLTKISHQQAPVVGLSAQRRRRTDAGTTWRLTLAHVRQTKHQGWCWMAWTDGPRRSDNPRQYQRTTHQAMLDRQSALAAKQSFPRQLSSTYLAISKSNMPPGVAAHVGQKATQAIPHTRAWFAFV